MKKRHLSRYIKSAGALIIFFLLLSFGNSFGLTYPIFPSQFLPSTIVSQANDSTKSRFKVKKTTPDNENDTKNHVVDLRTPENLKEETEYDEKNNVYRIGTKLGDSYLNTPVLMTEEEYRKWSMQKSIQAYYRTKNDEEYKNKGKEKFDFTDMRFDLGPAAKIFGPGGVRITTRGSAELKIGANTKNIDNPSLPARNRKTFGFDFQEKVNINVNGKVGDKLDMTLNYNTEATFDYDMKNMKLQYEGKEDEIIKLIEAGNVSMPTNSSLIKGASSLFGIRTDMQFGKLKLQTVVSQKNSTSKNVSSKGKQQYTDFELSVNDYEENRHFFLAHYFRDTYDANMSQLPNVLSGITINRAEVWITNKTGTTSNTRNIVAFTDMAEYDHISNNNWSRKSDVNPSNNSNNLYEIITTNYAQSRDISMTTSTLDGQRGMSGGTDYEKLESARLLSSSEYTLNTALGYISLKTTLQPDQVLAVAYEYTYRGQRYQVGEFSTDIKENNSALFVKALKNTSNTPRMGNWHLMMKNVYSLGAESIEKQRFKLDVKYLSDTTGVYLSYLPEAGLKDKPLLRLLNLDRLDNNNKPYPNGYFDFIEGYTINTQTGRIYFPVVEPFGSHMAKAIGNPATAARYTFQALYDSTKTVAKQIAEQDKYILTGQYIGNGGSKEIQLGAINIPPGSVIVTAGGQTLIENADYVVNYSMGTVEIINQSILDAGTQINVSLESNTFSAQERKTMLGMNWQYDFSKNFQLGGTLMHLTETPYTNKVAMGSEPLNNTLWGLNLAWKQQSQWLTNMMDKLPFLNCTTPSTINFTAEFAQLIAGSNSSSQGNASYIDDFENTKNGIDISSPMAWSISSTPSMFTESKLSNNIQYGFNRALLSWYRIDPLFTRRSSSLTPSHIKSDLEQLSNHYVREVYQRELFPFREQIVGESSTQSILNLAYYPSVRGPYNLNTNVEINGNLMSPETKWGGMMRKIETSDFETANIEYIEFWLLDPFIYSRNQTGDYTGDLYINLGEISEDILKDGKKFYESGMPIDEDPSKYTETIWGRVPLQNSVTYAFNTSSGSRDKQDVGLNGLSSANERNFPTYQEYLRAIQGKVSPEVFDSISKDPAGDDYHYFRGSDFDATKTPILQRYMRINNPEGNSVDSDHSPEKYSTAYKTTPDVEDINQDYTLNEYEKYYQYRISMHPDSLQIGSNYIVDKRTASVRLRNGNTESVDWFLFRVPIKKYERKEGNISDFNSIRFMRMFLTNFQKPIVLRFATLELVRGEWRNYEQALYAGKAPSISGTMEVSAVNIEENNDKTPVNYVLPPGITREVIPGQTQMRESNEQALSIIVRNLATDDARAVYNNMNIDLRRYKHLQTFVHANALPGDRTLENDQVSMFIRLGSDYKNNFYEYEIPLKLTPEGRYTTREDAKIVWPEENMLDIDLSIFTNLKRERNKKKAVGMANYSSIYSEYDSSKPNNKISIMGNPSLGEIRTVMIGVRNNSRSTKSIEVWVNEMRLQQYSNKGGWAAQGNLNLQLSDVGSVNLTGHVETDGFGGLEERVNERRTDNLYQYSVSTNFELGRFLPEKAKVQAPIYFSYSKEKTVPKYNPLDTDMNLKDALNATSSRRERDSLENMTTSTVENSNFSLSNMRVNIVSANPMPYDPGNFSFGYSHSHKRTTGETTVWETDDQWKWNANYTYSPKYKEWQPFKNAIKSKNKWWKLLKEEQINFLPQNISINSDITRSYYELQERDLDNLNNQSLPLTWASDFLWNRQFALRWDFTKTISTSFTSATNAEIVQPNSPVNKDLYPDRYSAWKDSVWHSIKNLGTPLSYQQDFKASWKIPINKLPIFDWLNTDVNYTATYSWNRGAQLERGTNLGNTITNSRTINANGKLNLEMLYNHVPFLKKTNSRFAGGRPPKAKTVIKPYEQEVQLKTDTTLNISHNLRNKRIRVQAFKEDGTHYALKYKIKNHNIIEVQTRDSIKVKVKITPGRKAEDTKWYNTMQYAARAAMMVRNVSISYRNSFNMSIPGFLPQIGDIFGQRSSGGLQPGLDFAFGLTDESYIQKAHDRGWLLNNDSVATPATTNANEDLQIRMLVEPFKNFKIDLNASRTMTKAKSIQYMYAGMPTTQTGSFSMTTISISSAFESIGSADNNYSSKTFNKFVKYLDVFRNRIEARYANAPYPEQSALAGQLFNPENGTISKYSSDVMIPAFLAAYCGGGTSSSLDLFPSVLRMLPNWKVTYGGLSKLPWIKDHFKSFNINHSYQSIYQVGSYNTYTSYITNIGGMGFIENITSGNPTPSSMFDISSISLNENFSPLVGVDMTLNNNLSAKVEYRRSRILNLSMTSQQINETRSSDWVIGLGYKINDLKIFTGNRKSRNRRSGKSQQQNQSSNASSNASEGMNNELNLRLDFSLRDQSALNRDIISLNSQATSGNKALKISFIADYTLSKLLTLSAYYDRQTNTPLLSSSSYPTTQQDFGVSMRFSLNR